VEVAVDIYCENLRGGIPINKPPGISSFDVIRRLRLVLGKDKKLGHAGTLDPAAQGLLLILAGEATRVQHLLKDFTKEYQAQVRLGIATDTLDAEGRVTEESEVPPLDEPAIRSALDKLTGTRMQRPPRYSALKVAGRRAYDMARQGEEFELPRREITIHEIELLSWQNPLIGIRTRVSSGTYIRSLAAEIGGELALPASLAALTRTSIGDFKLNRAIGLDNISVESIKKVMIPIQILLNHLPNCEVDADVAQRFLQGKPVGRGIDTALLETPLSVIYSTDHSKAFLCEPRKQMLWSKRLIYNDADTDG
jgi:tRNA pseudouridine55 synthase